MSNDVYFYKLAVALGPEAMIDTARALGVDSGPASTFPPSPPATSAARTPSERDGGTWFGGSTVILGIGQGYLQVTPLQNARWTAAVATGNLVTPRLGLAVGKGEGTYTALPPPVATPRAVRRRARADPRGDAVGRDRRHRGPARRPPRGGRRQDRYRAGRRTHRWELRQLDDSRGANRRPRDRGDGARPGARPGWQQRQGRGGHGLRHYLDHRADVLATGPVQTP